MVSASLTTGALRLLSTSFTLLTATLTTITVGIGVAGQKAAR